MYPPIIARENPDALAYVMAGSSTALTYGELDRRSNQLAHAWWDAGVRPGDSVVIAMENRLSWPIVTAAGMRSGLLVTPVNWHLRADDLAVLFGEARPTAVVTSTALAPAVTSAIATAEVTPLSTICVDGPADGCLDLAVATTGLPETPLDDELLGARVLFSGGTTGRPKRFAHPLLGIHPADAPRRHSALVDALGIDRDTVFLSPAPNYHAAPFTFGLIVLAAGGTVVCLERFDPAAAMRAIAAHGVTHSQWVPTMLIRLLGLPDRDTVPLSPTHRVAVTSGAPCPPHVKDDIAAWWGPILHEYYGASEGYGHTYIAPDEVAAHRGSVGKPLGGARVRIVDAEGQTLPAGQDGTVCFEALDGDRPALREMGDIGHLDADGFLYLVGRHGFMVISGGVNIHPDEVEAVLLRHPDVADVGVIGVPDPDLGEVVKAVVERRPGATLTEDGLIAWSRDNLAHFKAPRLVEFTDDLPRTPTGKLVKRELLRRFSTPTASARN